MTINSHNQGIRDLYYRTNLSIKEISERTGLLPETIKVIVGIDTPIIKTAEQKISFLNQKGLAVTEIAWVLDIPETNVKETLNNET
jgi:hypothetical protein